MAEEIGKIKKPLAEHFKLGKKIYLVPIVFAGESAPSEYKEKCSLYWQQVEEQLTNLETKIGKTKRIYHESITEDGDEGMKVIERLNPSSYQIIQKRRDSGARLEAIEDAELLDEVTDWQRCLFLGFISEKVASTVSQSYLEASKKRYEFMAKKINETLEDDEAGLLFIGEGSNVQYPNDVEVFSVFPPALDEIHRWLRDQAIKLEKAKEAKQAEEVKKAEEKEQVKEAEEKEQVKEAEETEQVKEAEETEQVKEAEETEQVKEAEETEQVKEAEETEQVKEAEETEQVKEAEQAKE